MSTDTRGVRPADSILDFSRAAPGPRVEAPTRFAVALKRARYARGWTQARLAKELGLPERTVASWERGARMPGAGIVSILGDLLSTGNAAAPSDALMAAYLADDLEAEERRATDTYPRFAAHARRVRDHLAAAEE